MCLHCQTLQLVSATLRKGPRPGKMEEPLKAPLQPQPLVDGTEGQREASYTPGWAQPSPLHRADKAPCRPPPGAWKLPVRAVSPCHLSASLEAGRTEADGGGGWMPSLTTALP